MVRQWLARGPPTHEEGAAGVGAAWEDAAKGGGVTGRLSKFLLSGNTVGAVVWGGELGVVGANVADSGGSSCGVPVTSD